MLHRDIELLKEPFKQIVKAMLARLDQLGIKYYINETLRDPEVQRAYFAQGRAALADVNELRKKAGLWPLTEAENDKKVTWTLKSKHLEGLAIDICPSKNGYAWWAAPDEEWKEIADISRECGLDAGYFWEQKDAPHHQIKE